MDALREPDAYDLEEYVTLRPDDELEWELSVHPQRFGLEDEFVRHQSLLGGEFRSVYWGLDMADTVVATRFSVDFDHGQE